MPRLAALTAARSFRIATEPAGPGRGTWWHVRIYETDLELQDAAHRYATANGAWPDRAGWAGVGGCCQTALWREQSSGTWKQILPANKLLGVIRLSREHLTVEVCTHEALHAALAAYRMLVKRDVRLGVGTDDREERLCYIAGELTDQLLGTL